MFESKLIKRSNAISPQRKEIQRMMDIVYRENPSYWPYGISATEDAGDLWLIRDKMTKKAAGWAGWQEVHKNGKKTGYYHIGILPEFREKGLAKEAVFKVIQSKINNVDEVKAFIVPTNQKSMYLAMSLGVPYVHKVASVIPNNSYESMPEQSLEEYKQSQHEVYSDPITGEHPVAPAISVSNLASNRLLDTLDKLKSQKLGWMPAAVGAGALGGLASNGFKGVAQGAGLAAGGYYGWKYGDPLGQKVADYFKVNDKYKNSVRLGTQIGTSLLGAFAGQRVGTFLGNAFN